MRETQGHHPSPFTTAKNKEVFRHSNYPSLRTRIENGTCENTLSLCILSWVGLFHRFITLHSGVKCRTLFNTQFTLSARHTVSFESECVADIKLGYLSAPCGAPRGNTMGRWSQHTYIVSMEWGLSTAFSRQVGRQWWHQSLKCTGVWCCCDWVYRITHLKPDTLPLFHERPTEHVIPKPISEKSLVCVVPVSVQMFSSMLSRCAAPPNPSLRLARWG